MPLVVIICDGGGTFGFGNLRRSATLGAELKRRGYGVCVKAVSERARSLLPESPADQGEADLWLLDIPYNGDAWVAEGRRHNRPVVALDYEGNADPDLVISIFPRGTWHSDGASSRRHLVGLDYAIVEAAIVALSPAPPGQGVLVLIGGGDNQGLGECAALELNKRGCAVTLIEGPLAATTMPRLPPEIVRLSSPPDLARRMASCAWSVTGAGGAMLEMLCLGKPAHVLPRNPHEEALAQLVFQSGGVLGISLETLGLPDAAARKAVSAQARALVDGKGVGRIVDAVADLL